MKYSRGGVQMDTSKRTYWGVTFAVLIAAAVLFLYPTNYYIKKPGHAYDAAQYIDVEHGDSDDSGHFRFTTVSVMQATPFLYGLALFSPHQSIVERDEVFQDEEDQEEYEVRQLKLMESSKFNAIRVAYEQAGLNVKSYFKGLTVLNVRSQSAADGKLQTGDVIVEAAGELLQDALQFTKLLEGKNNGDTITVVYEREKQRETTTITLKEIPKAEGKIGLGITYAESSSIQSDPPVDMNIEDIGGPSAGLMFTLEILNQLLPEDITQGYDIAGTGTMNADGSVGRIGGIDKKVVAAAKEGVYYFLAPDDEITKEMLAVNPTLKTNYEEALQAIKHVDTKMEVIPVKTIEDALNFLTTLQPKNE